MRLLSLGLPLGALLSACSAEPTTSTDDTSDSAEVATCPYERPERPAPEALQAGVARVLLPAPVGSGTAGNNPLGNGNASVSPFAEGFPATNKLRGQPDIKVVVLSRGEGREAIFVRVDAIGMFSQLRKELAAEIARKTS